MFPLRDDNPTFHTSVATFAIVVAAVYVWVRVQSMGMPPGLVESIWRYGLIPAELLGRVEPGTRVPAMRGMTVTLTGEPAPWTLISSMFLHGSWLHLIGNLWFLIVFGDNVEDAMGGVRFTLFYLLCGVAAAAAQILAAPGSTIPMVGASGAIGGVMGAYLVLYPLAPVHLLVFWGFFVSRVVVPAFMMLLYWFAFQVLAGMLTGSEGGGVAFWAHAGGFAAGVILVGPFCSRRRLAERRYRRGRARRLLMRV